MTTQNRNAKRRRLIVILSVIALAIIVGIAFWLLVVRGMLPGSSATHPPCSELPSRDEVVSALDANESLQDELTAQGPEVSVDVATPCSDQPDAALVQVSFSNDEERDNIERVLNTQDGFGVPVTLVGN